LETIDKKPIYAFLQGGGEMGALIRNYDWSQTSLGMPGQWPQSLRLSISMILNSRFPMFLFWGPELVCFYNDAFRPSLGNEGKHPWALGKKGEDVWEEIWPTIKPWLYQVLSGGEAIWFEDQLVPFYRNGQMEDIYWTFGYSALMGDTESIEGVLVVCQETTQKVLGVNRLVESENRFRNLIREATVGIVVLNGEDMVVEVVNDVYGSLIGRTADELLHKKLFSVIPETEAEFRPLLEKVRRTGEPLYLNDCPYFVWLHGVKKEGFLNLVYQPYKDVDSNITGVMALCHDVTEQVLARRKLQASEQKVRSLVESAPFPIGVYVGMEMRIELANQAIMDAWGKGNDIIGRLYTEVLPELDNDKIIEQLQSVYTTGVPYHARNQRVNLVVNGKLQPYYFNYSFTPLYDATGKVYGVMNTAADVTDLNLAMQKVEESETNLRNMILQAPVAMCIFRGENFIIEVANNSMFQFWGRASEEVLHKPLFEALPEAKGQGYEELMLNVLETGKGFSANELTVTLPRDGSVQTVFINFSYEPLREIDGTITGIMTMATDVTEQVMARKKIEEVVALRTRELAEANEALTRTNQELARSNTNLEEFAYAASHDMKEPIRKIHFFSDRLKGMLHGRMQEEEKSLFDRMEAASKRMSSLIDDLLSYSQVSVRPKTLEKVDLNQLVDIVLHDFDIEIEEKKATVFVNSLPVIQGYHRQLQQAFQNLIGNALKYCRPGVAPYITISSQSMQGKTSGLHLPVEELEKEYYIITVSDNGIGFEQEEAERIFNVFTRLHGNAEYQGTGVGLSIARKVVENHKGYIWAESEPGKGATFKLLLPVE
jgi:PAS domain S-box-containing protein